MSRLRIVFTIAVTSVCNLMIIHGNYKNFSIHHVLILQSITDNDYASLTFNSSFIMQSQKEHDTNIFFLIALGFIIAKLL